MVGSGRLGGVFVRGALCSWLIIGEKRMEVSRRYGGNCKDLISLIAVFVVIWVHRLRLQRVALWC